MKFFLLKFSDGDQILGRIFEAFTILGMSESITFNMDAKGSNCVIFTENEFSAELFLRVLRVQIPGRFKIYDEIERATEAMECLMV